MAVKRAEEWKDGQLVSAVDVPIPDEQANAEEIVDQSVKAIDLLVKARSDLGPMGTAFPARATAAVQRDALRLCVIVCLYLVRLVMNRTEEI